MCTRTESIITYLNLQQISVEDILPEIKTLLGNEIGNVAKLATVILIEKKKGLVITFLADVFSFACIALSFS